MIAKRDFALLVNETGQAILEGKAKGDPGDLSKLLRKHAPLAERIGFETGRLQGGFGTSFVELSSPWFASMLGMHTQHYWSA